MQCEKRQTDKQRDRQTNRDIDRCNVRQTDKQIQTDAMGDRLQNGEIWTDAM